MKTLFLKMNWLKHKNKLQILNDSYLKLLNQQKSDTFKTTQIISINQNLLLLKATLPSTIIETNKQSMVILMRKACLQHNLLVHLIHIALSNFNQFRWAILEITSKANCMINVPPQRKCLLSNNQTHSRLET